MQTVILKIPTMKSQHCQLTVSNTVKSIGGRLKSIAPAQAEIELVNGLIKKDIVLAVEKAGYKVVND